MKHHYGIFSIILLVCLPAVAFILLNHSGRPVPVSKNVGAPASIGGDDAMERIAWEFNRLKDPETGIIPHDMRARELAYAATLPGDEMLTGKMQAAWMQRGPWNVGGRTRAFGIDIMDTSKLIAGSASGGMWRSTNGGQTWNRTFTPTQYESITCLAQDKRPGKTNTWYSGSGEAYGASASATGAYYIGNGMWKSTDNGLTWNILSSTSSGTPHSFDSPWDIIWNLGLNPADTMNDVVYSACYGFIYKSIDGGTTWTVARGVSSPASYFTDIIVSSTGVIYATLSSDGGQKGIWRSPDGITWTNITPANFPATYNRIVIGLSPGDQNQVWFLGNTPGSGQPDTNFMGQVEWNSLWKYRYLSGDGSGTGGSWSNRSSSLPSTGSVFDKFNCQGSYDLVVKVHPNDTNTVFIGGTNLYRSTNGFINQNQTAFIGGYQQGATLPVVNLYANHHPDQHYFEFMPGNPGTVFSINDGGIFKSSNCMAPTVTWSSINNGYLTSMFYTVAVDHATPNNDVVVAGAQDNGSWFTNNTNLQTPWVTPRGGDGSYCQIADGRTNYYLSIQNGKMMKATLDANGNVQTFARIDPIGGTGYLFINPYALDPNNNNLMYLAGGKKLWRNDNLSQIPMAGNWDSISTNWVPWVDTVPATGAKISAVAVSKVPANRVYYGTTIKNIFRVDNANTGTPTPVDITSTNNMALMPSGNVSCIAVNPNNADEILVVYSNYQSYSFYYSASGGLPTNSWVKVGGNLEPSNNSGPSVRWASIIPVSNGKIYMVATSTGLYATDTLTGPNTVWVKQGAATIGNSVCDMIDYRVSDGLVVVATHSHGIFSTHITSTGDIATVHEWQNVKETLQLGVYPNPVTSSASIEFMLEKRSNVKLVLLDAAGREVKRMLNEMKDAGKHAVKLDKGMLPGGLYYILLQAGELKETKKIVLAE